jgi:cell division protein FtsQ
MVAVGALVVLSGGYMLLRHSSLASVQHVTVTGVHGQDAAAIRSALADAATHMNTLAVSEGALKAAVSAYPIVRAVHAYPSFPHSLRIVVEEQPPVAAVTVDGVRTAVAADGAVLGTTWLSSTLAVVGGDYQLSRSGAVSGAALLSELALLGAAPAPLEREITHLYSGPFGLTAQLKGGLLVYFGDASRPRAKWLSLATVLVDPSSSGASSIDVRLPERPAAMFGSQSTAAAAASTAPGSTSTQAAGESAVAALAARLSEGTPAASPPAPTTSTEASATPQPETTESQPPASPEPSG